jgi:hypothetical protein
MMQQSGNSPQEHDLEINAVQHNSSSHESSNSPRSHRSGRYTSRGVDRHQPIPPSQVLLFPQRRPCRLANRKKGDIQAEITYGDAIIYKKPGTTRFLFQNVKGLTYTQSGDDHNYYLSGMLSYTIDVLGMAETNSGWQHAHLQSHFKQCLRTRLKFGKVVFASPSHQVDPLGDKKNLSSGRIITSDSR